MPKPVAIDVELAREQTPGCQHVTHFNNAGAALVPQPVLEAQLSHLRFEARSGGYEAADAAAPKLRATYEAVARLLGCRSEEVALFDSATTAWQTAFYGLGFRPGERILTGETEYASNYIAYLQVANRTGAVVEVIPSQRTGEVSLDALASMLDDRVRLVSLTHVPTNSGLVQPAEQIGALVRDSGALFLLDACQSAGQLPLDVESIGCDFLSATGRKYLRGPRGTGFLYVRSNAMERLEPPRLDLHGACWVADRRYELRPDARRFESWEYDVAARIGLGVALEYARAWGLQAIQERVTTLAETLRERLSALPRVTVHDLGRRRCGIVTFRVCGQPERAVRGALRAQRINISVADRHSALLDMQRRGLDYLLRASVHYYNTVEEIELLCTAVAKL